MLANKGSEDVRAIGTPEGGRWGVRSTIQPKMPNKIAAATPPAANRRALGSQSRKKWSALMPRLDVERPPFSTIGLPASTGFKTGATVSLTATLVSAEFSSAWTNLGWLKTFRRTCARAALAGTGKNGMFI